MTTHDDLLQRHGRGDRYERELLYAFIDSVRLHGGWSYEGVNAFLTAHAAQSATPEHDQKLLLEFCEWCAAHGWLSPQFGGTIAFFAARQLPPSVAAFAQRCAWLQPQDMTALALALRLVVELTTALPTEQMPRDVARDINALHGAIRDLEIGLELDVWVSTHTPEPNGE